MNSHSPFENVFFRLEPQHIDSVVALERQCFSMPWSKEQFQLAFSQRTFAAFGLWRRSGQEGTLLTDAGELIPPPVGPDGLQPILAYISFYHAVDELEILNIAVAPDYRRQGLGRHLLATALQAARKMGMERGVLEVRVTNIPALGLYQGLGFECVGRRPKYYADTGEDALIYALTL